MRLIHKAGLAAPVICSKPKHSKTSNTATTRLSSILKQIHKSDSS